MTGNQDQDGVTPTRTADGASGGIELPRQFATQCAIFPAKP